MPMTISSGSGRGGEGGVEAWEDDVEEKDADVCDDE